MTKNGPTGLVLLRCQAEVRAHGPGACEAVGLVDRGF
jgi:hypothetical protein